PFVGGRVPCGLDLSGRSGPIHPEVHSGRETAIHDSVARYGRKARLAEGREGQYGWQYTCLYAEGPCAGPDSGRSGLGPATRSWDECLTEPRRLERGTHGDDRRRSESVDRPDGRRGGAAGEGQGVARRDPVARRRELPDRGQL